MRYIAAYLLAVLGGNPTPSDNDVVKILQASGVETDKDSITALLKAMEGKNIEEVIAAGSKKLASFGAAGAAPAAAAGAGAAAGGGASAAKVVEKVVEEEEEIDMGGGMDMFGGEEDY